jgi:streptogramin lyase
MIYKRHLLRYIVGFFLIWPGFQSASQSRVGTWKDYFSFVNATKIADAGDKIFCATDGGLFFRDLSDNSLNKISTRDGLNDVGIRSLAWNESKKMLLVAYQNSNIDLILNDKIINLNDIKRKLLSGDKTIYNIVFNGDRAFLACGFGVVDIDLTNSEIKGTYLIGENGTQVKVFDVETDGNTIYAATESGIFSAALGNTNLLDYRNWKKINTIPHYTEKFSQLTRFNGNLIAVYTRDQWDGDEAYQYVNGQWQRILQGVGYFHDLQSNSKYLTATDREAVYTYDISLNRTGQIKSYTLGNETISPIQPKCAICTVDGSIWIADYENSMMRVSGQKYEQNLPSGPLSNTVFSLTTFQRELWTATGGRTDPWNNQFRAPVFQNLKEDEWSYFSKKQYPVMTGFFDMIQVVVDPSDAGHIFAASWGGGVLEFKNSQFVKRYNNLNSPLETAIPENPTEPYTRIGGMAFDKKSTLWITNSQSSKGLHSLSSGGEWKSFELPEVAGKQYTIGQIIVTANNDKWIVLPRGKDVYVVNNDGSKKKYLPVTSYFSNGEQEIYNRMNDVYSIAEDLNGDIWIGTSTGVAVFANPVNVWRDGTYYAYQPSLELNDGLYHPLLETETITSIVVDGANRKWLGTRSSGIYLVSDQGETEVLHFTTENSPLVSNTIICLALNQLSGELFIGTDKGLISYQSDAPQGSDDFSNVYAYPNPVRETYSGDINITGLMKDTDVRITDLSGNLVFKGTSLGRNLIWNGRNQNGNKVSTGVYLIFCADASGENTHITKLLVIH